MDCAGTIGCLVLLPLVAGVAAFVAPTRRVRGWVVLAGCVAILVAGVAAVLGGSGEAHLGGWSGTLAFALELVVGAAVLWVAIRIRSVPVLGMSAAQLLLTLFTEAGEGHPDAQFILDPLAAILVLIVNVVGALIVIFSIGYMEEHRRHVRVPAVGEGAFFLVMLGFLGMMNGLVLANDIRWLAVFWEVTTLCSFVLIGHDGTDVARVNARRALTINSIGGVALALAAFVLGPSGSESLTALMDSKAVLPFVFLCVAALTKSAQVPFQSWLLGAMVAPTPVSALLHSATMVKAGSYLLLRLAPAFAGEPILETLALAGAFTFASTALLAVGQSNGKKVLAYSTISNLGLIVACAGLNTPLAYSAAILVLCFHAVSKGLLFLCVGTVEQRIGSRDIEDMGELMHRMPLTATVFLLGMVSMLLPPFGMLLSKWMAIEGAAGAPLVMILAIAGSALTVLFWAKWLGRVQTVSYHQKYSLETMSPLMRMPLVLLGGAVVLLGIVSVFIYSTFVEPLAIRVYAETPVPDVSWELMYAAGSFMYWPFVALPVLAALAAWLTSRRTTLRQVRLPYLGGENFASEWNEADGVAPYTFRSARDEAVKAWAGSIYMRSTLDETRITRWVNLVAWLIIMTLFGELGL